MAKKITKKQLKVYVSELTIWQMVDVENYIQALKDQIKNMGDAQKSNPPGEPPPPPRH